MTGGCVSAFHANQAPPPLWSRHSPSNGPCMTHSWTNIKAGRRRHAVNIPWLDHRALHAAWAACCRCCCRVAMEQPGSRRSSFWLKAGEQAHFAISIPVLGRCSLVLVLERLSPAGEPLLLLRHEAAPRVEAWERRRASVLTVEADAWDHEGFHRRDAQARLRCADLAAGLWVVGAFNYSEVQLIPWP